MIHQLKIESKYFVQIMTGVKTFEVRFNDRDFHAGDYLGLNEITDHQCNDKGERKETGRFLLVRVLNVFDNPVFVKDGYVIMSIAPCKINLGYIRCVECGAKTPQENFTEDLATNTWNRRVQHERIYR